jgi:NAD(P)-dependent dehydrogenase (short-subunit alcohol dehydrogenase family)
MNIDHKTVLITGANRGIGRALVDEALERGAGRVYAATRMPFQHPDPRVSSLTLDVKDIAQIKRASAQVGGLDVLINNAGLQIYEDLGDNKVIQQILDVNLFGMLNVTRAFLPLLVRSRGAIVNNLSLVALASLPAIPGYSLSKAAAASMTQSLRSSLASQGVSVHAVFIGPTDTDMNRGFDIPKVPPELTARGIFDGLQKEEEDIFPDPMAQQFAEGWRKGVAKGMERQFAAIVPGAPSVA